jgi:hypothetical protein
MTEPGKVSRIEVLDLIGPTTQMAPLFGDSESLVIEEHVPILSGEHPVIVSRDSLQVPIVDLRASGLVAIDDRISEPVSMPVEEVKRTNDTTAPLELTEDEVAAINAIAAVNEAALANVAVAKPLRDAAPEAIEDSAAAETVKSRSSSTSLGVAPLEPATTVRAPFVNDTPVPRWSPLAVAKKIQEPQAHPIQRAISSESEPHERTAMLPLDPSSGMSRGGPWQALVSVARSLRSIRWWRRRRTTAKVRRVDR